VLALLVSAESNLGCIPQIAFEQYYFVAQRQGLSNTVEEVPVQLLSGLIRQIALHHG
jgi:hypothetical protein